MNHLIFGVNFISPTNAVTSKVKGQGRKVTWSVWQVLAHKSRTKSPRHSKISNKVAHPTSIMRTSFNVKRPNVKVTWPITVNNSNRPGDRLLRPKVYHIYRTGRPIRTSKIKIGTSMDNRCHGQLQLPVKLVLAHGRGYGIVGFNVPIDTL